MHVTFWLKMAQFPLCEISESSSVRCYHVPMSSVRSQSTRTAKWNLFVNNSSKTQLMLVFYLHVNRNSVFEL